jgi:hypothetical protein
MAVIVGVTGNNPLLQGTPDADEIYGNINGTVTFVAGNDRIFGLAEDDLITGDGCDVAPNGRGGNDVVQGGDGFDEIYGDACDQLFGVGGNDTLYQNGDVGLLVGDAYDVETLSKPGNDKLYGTGTLVGDSVLGVSSVVLGNDLLSAKGASEGSFLFGDVQDGDVDGTGRGGRDTLWGSEFDDELFGDAGSDIDDGAVGGNDTLAGFGGDDLLCGDAGFGIFEAAKGGNDVLRGGAGGDLLFGDAPELADFAQGGADRINGGGGDDLLWGDGELFDDAVGGRDRFVFDGAFGDDLVFDFRQEDADQLQFYGLTQSEVTITQDSGDTVLTTLGDDSVTLVGFLGTLTVGTDLVFI